MSQDQVRKPRASLGSSEGEDIFGTFDAGVAKRFLGIDFQQPRHMRCTQ